MKILRSCDITAPSTSPAEGNNQSVNPSTSADGRYVAFISIASNLVPGDTNGLQDVFVRDRQTGVTERVSVSSGGEQADACSTRPSISADGRYVAFESDASNLIAGDMNGTFDIYVRDRQTGVTEMVSISSGGFQGDSTSSSPSISADGRYVAFQSQASNLVSGDNNGTFDIYIRDRQTRITEIVSVSSDGMQGIFESHSPYKKRLLRPSPENAIQLAEYLPPPPV